MKTQADLEKEWGLKHTVEVMAILTDWYLKQLRDNQIIITDEACRELWNKSQDAYKLLVVRLGNPEKKDKEKI